MVLLAKRVSAPKCAPNSPSTSETPRDLAACCAASNRSRHCFCEIISAPFASTGIRGTHVDVVEARWACAVAGADGLLGLSLAAIRDAPQPPMIAIRDGGARVPELGGDAAVSGILQHANALAVLDFPGDFATELEVIAFVVDRPAAVGLHVNGVADARENFLQRLFPRQQADVGHANQRKPRPAGGSHGAVGKRCADGGGG